MNNPIKPSPNNLPDSEAAQSSLQSQQNAAVGHSASSELIATPSIPVAIISSPNSASMPSTLALISLVALILLCITWEAWLAPLRPGGSWLVLKALPLFIPLPGIWKRNVYTLQWSSMLILLYFIEGCVRAYSETGLAARLAWGEMILVIVFYASALFYLRPYKLEAKKRKKLNRTPDA